MTLHTAYLLPQLWGHGAARDCTAFVGRRSWPKVWGRLAAPMAQASPHRRAARGHQKPFQLYDLVSSVLYRFSNEKRRDHKVGILEKKIILRSVSDYPTL